ncbi:uncharacterized protein BCR38DRAFT_483169 [Pseudomassariella vexata]|uniref:Ferritin-like domain-domain-containing protein n=1 Tax=Pseudomassariella vexata TaxID=1141098 RepID=A0A1Y2E7N0_9PEZI|nr:uncharacterized protein BCR38DRAFT_483169 [Pseudomassariella vexata]ORY67552.1 hypothetical protein BCR38DRAFT_483169 [Pseudomassariella vexata]
MGPSRVLAGTNLFVFASRAIAAPLTATTTFAAMASTTVPNVPITNVTSYRPYKGTATTTGAISTTVLAASAPQPAPYMPAGGLGINGSVPLYRVQSDFDSESIALGLYQEREWIELDLIRWGRAIFSVEYFEAAGLTSEDRAFLEYMADQEIGHATLLTNMLGLQAPKQCTYNYPVSNVREYVDFFQKLTRFGESGVYGFLNHLDSREVVWFEVGIPQSWAWTLNATGSTEDCGPATTQNRALPLSYPGRHVFLNWDEPGKPVGPDNSYVTSTSASAPRFAVWVSQLNVTYSPLLNISGNKAYTIQPDASVYEGDPAANGTMFMALTDENLFFVCDAI